MTVCKRCGGRMFPNRDDDMACVSCGAVLYRTPPLEADVVRAERTTPGGLTRKGFGRAKHRGVVRL